MVNMIDDSPISASDDSINAVAVYKEKVDKDEQFRLHQEVKSADKGKQKHDWRHQMNFNPRYDEY